MKNIKNITWGVVFVLAGVLVVLNGFGVVDFKLFFDGWWTLLIIVPCLNGLLFDRDKLGNLTGLLLGVLLLLWRQNILPSKAIGLSIGGAILVCFGIRMIWGSIRKKESGLKFKFNKKSKKSKSGCAVFAGCDLDFNGKVFDGADLVAVFGGVECDLRHAIIEKDCVIDAVAIFGGIDILLPPHVNVRTDAFSIFGGLDDLTTSDPNGVTIYVNGVCIFGGIEIQ